MHTSLNLPWVDTDVNSNTGGRLRNVVISENLFTGWVGSNQQTYLIRNNDVDGLEVSIAASM